MKKYIGILILGFLFVPVFSFAQQTGDVDPNAGASTCVTIVNNMRYKDRDISKNGEVSALQDFLQSNGYLNSEPTGYLGLLTVKAVKNFQKSNNITPTGYVGPITLAKINDSICNGTDVSSVTPPPAVSVSTTIMPSKISVTPPTISQQTLPAGCASTSAPSITVLSPNGGELYTGGQQFTVKWKSCNIPSSTLLEVNIFGGNVMGFLAPNGTSNDGEETFKVGSDWSPASDYKITVGTPLYGFDNSALAVSDTSNNPFTISATTGASLITILSPNGGETWSSGSKQVIKWQDAIATSVCPVNTSSGATCVTPLPTYYDINLIPYSAPCTSDHCPMIAVHAPYLIAQKTTGNSFGWFVGTSVMGIGTGDAVIPDGSYTMQICRTGTDTCDSSDNTFTISSVITGTPSITVLSPNGGETYAAGQQITVKWDSQNMSANDNVYINLDVPQSDGSFVGYQLSAQSPNTGSAIVTLPNKTNWPLMNYGSLFKISVLKTPGFSPWDRSDNLFTINSPSLINYDVLATCIKNSGAVFYGTFWCPHCQATKNLFGSSASLLPYVECSTADGKGQTQICIDKNIQGYPTWIFADGTSLSGEQTLQTLANKTSCTLPQ